MNCRSFFSCRLNLWLNNFEFLDVYVDDFFIKMMYGFLGGDIMVFL